jgi:hypothetical protein
MSLLAQRHGWVGLAAALALACGAGESPPRAAGTRPAEPPEEEAVEPTVEAEPEPPPPEAEAPAQADSVEVAPEDSVDPEPAPAEVEAPPRRGGIPRVRVAEVRVGPVYPRELIRRVIRRHFDEVRRCVERDPDDQLCVDGAVMEFTIDGDGAVGRCAARSSNEARPLTPATEACLEAAFGAMRFPSPPGGGQIQVRYPLQVNCAS